MDTSNNGIREPISFCVPVGAVSFHQIKQKGYNKNDENHITRYIARGFRS